MSFAYQACGRCCCRANGNVTGSGIARSDIVDRDGLLEEMARRDRLRRETRNPWLAKVVPELEASIDVVRVVTSVDGWAKVAWQSTRRGIEASRVRAPRVVPAIVLGTVTLDTTTLRQHVLERAGSWDLIIKIAEIDTR